MMFHPVYSAFTCEPHLPGSRSVPRRTVLPNPHIVDQTKMLGNNAVYPNDAILNHVNILVVL